MDEGHPTPRAVGTTSEGGAMNLLEKVTRLSNAAKAAGVYIAEDFALRNENGIEALVSYDTALELLSR